MKRLCLGVLLALVLLSAQTISAQTPCTLVCQPEYPCDYSCDLCVGDPGLWEVGGGCWGDIVEGTCGDIGQCGAEPNCNEDWTYDDPGSYQGAEPEIYWDPYCEFQGGQWVCDYENPWKCTVSDVYRYSLHNACDPPSYVTYCGTGFPDVIGYYSYSSAEWECCWDANRWNCGTGYYPQCPNF